MNKIYKVYNCIGDKREEEISLKKYMNIEMGTVIMLVQFLK